MTALTKLLSSKGEVNYPDQTISLDPASPYPSGYSGYSVDISDNYAIVGAYNISSGLVFIYNAKTGAYIRTLYPSIGYTSGRWGYAVATTDNYAIVGGPYHDNTGTDSGYAAIFNPTTGARLHDLANPNAYGSPTSDYFGGGR